MFNKTLFFVMLSMMISFKSLATSFQVMPLEQLIEESSSGAEVELKSKKSYKNNLGMIVTDFSFKVNEGFNISESDLNDDAVTITMAGGTVNGVTAYTDSAPEFSIGERSFLLLRKIESKFYLSNFTMGKYKIEEVDGQTYYVSTVFPTDSDLGRVKKERMVDLMKLKFKITRAPEPDSFRPKTLSIENPLPHHVAKFEERKPAQINDQNPEGHCLAMWGFFALFSVSGIVIWWKLKKGVSV